ncbi:hypothetical protein V6R86_05010 [Sphingomonas kaistensis]|uniref:Beta-glucosidase n=1 Tax=Sphingomonas kaistensis TaxID=298708 RepID=A0ABZ2G0I3_9SPHN
MHGPETIFASFFQGGFECSSHRRRDGVRLDLLRATGHDRHVASDYRQLRDLGLRTIRDGVRWHLIEKSPGRYDWSSWTPALEAGADIGMEVIWDLFHYGSPDHVDQGGEDFPRRFADFALAAVEHHQQVVGGRPMLCLVNEMSFMAWAVEVNYFPRPAGAERKGWFKEQLARTAIAAAAAIRADYPDALLVWAEPLVHVAPRDHRRKSIEAAERERQGQFEAYDWLTGRARPELGGDPSFADLIGLNYYPHNQWYLDGPTIPMGHHEYRSLADMLIEVSERYDKPLFLAETGAEGSGRAAWLHHVCAEAREAMERGADLQGICWFPITAYPGWDNSRHAEAGLLSTVMADGRRQVDARLLAELREQQERFAAWATRKPERVLEAV